MPSQNGINDDELNKMIASLQNEQRNAGANGGSNMPGVAAPVSGMVIQPLGNAPTAPVSTPTSGPFAAPQPTVPTAEPNVNVGGSVFGNAPAAQPAEPVASAAPVTPESSEETVPIKSSNLVHAGELDDIKRQAITELRPLVDKLDLPAEDKFDTLLLLIRTTDDSSLIPLAHNAAMGIADDARRAKALLDIIKEIDFFGQQK